MLSEPNTITVTPSVTTTYNVSGVWGLASVYGPSASATVTVTPTSLPPPTCVLAAIPSTIAHGGSSLLTASCSPAADSYAWTGGTCTGTVALDPHCSASPDASGYVSPSVTTTYTVTGRNAGGTGNTASTTITVGTSPSPPTNVTATVGNGSITVSFTPGIIGSGKLINYAARCSKTIEVSPPPPITPTTGGSSPITVSGLTNGATYTCQVQTTSTVGTSDWSASSNNATLASGASALLTVAKSGSGSGTVTSSPAGISCGSTCSGNFSGSVTLAATPASGSYFAGWSGDCTGVGSCVVTMNAAKNVTAIFKPQPFAAVTTTTITEASATITTEIIFNADDVSKQKSIFITGWVPVGSLSALGIATAGLSRDTRVTMTKDNPFLGGEVHSRQAPLETILATSNTTYVLVQLTLSGWVLVENGQLIPYLTGVLGGYSSSQTILNNTNPSLLPGAQFCVGYGTSDTEMITSGRMMPVAVIPDATGNAATTGSCNVAAGIKATEFYKSDLNHYFMTSYQDEALALDNKPEWNWARTAKTFNVWQTRTSAPSNASPVCRFFGVFSNGTVGSHFYTVDTVECEYVKGRLDWGWGYEGNAFYAIKPTGSACPDGTSPIYRVYNNGMSGAPNHRYMTTQAEVNAMVAQGWVSEGTAFCGG